VESSAAIAIEPERFRHVLVHYPTGVAIATAMGDDGVPAGMAVGSFSSVSLDPPLVGFMPDKRSSSFPRIRASGSFCINVLAEDQESACRAFASRGGDKYSESTWHPAGSGSPILDGAVAWIDCDIDSVLDAGDHYIVLGRVRDLDVTADSPPLPFVPPLCCLFVAWAGEAAQQAWLDRLDPGMAAAEAQRYRDMVDRVRRRGWSIALGSRSQIAFELDLVELGAAGGGERQRAVQEAARRVGPGGHEPDDATLAPDRALNVRNLNAPVFDPAGDVVLMLTLIGFPRSATGADVERDRDRLVSAAASITRALGGEPLSPPSGTRASA
jgi:flavin reductase (DIM6/NTAB) family NADH-FMN oxidoreductase RutF